MIYKLSLLSRHLPRGTEEKKAEKFSLDNGLWSIALLIYRLLNCYFICVLNTASLTVYSGVCRLSAR